MAAALGYSDALAALKGAAPLGITMSLAGIVELTEELGRPQDSYRSVQITGTNGKTSTAWMVHALLRAHGHRAALYTSPELERYPERMQVDDQPVSDEQFASAVVAALDAAERVRPGAHGHPGGFTEFELLTAAALWLFRELEVEIAVLEVGLGGRLDATSVVSPAVAVVTGVGLDHMALLGDTVEAIAAEKAAIIKPGSVPVLGPGTQATEQIFLEQAERVGTCARAVREVDDPSPVSEDLTVRYRLTERPSSPGGCTSVDVTGLHGCYSELRFRGPAYQAANIATAVATVEATLGSALDEDVTRAAFTELALPGRFELVHRDPPVIVDGSHNPQAASVLASAIEAAWPNPARRPLVVLGVLSDKDAAGIAQALAPVAAGFVVTEPDSPRALDAAELGSIVESVCECEVRVIGSLDDAVSHARAAGDHGVVITGSLTTAGQARCALRDASAT